MIKNNIILKVDNNNYKFTIKYIKNTKINKAFIRIFTDYNKIENRCGCESNYYPLYDLCGNLITPHDQHIVNYLDYSAVDINDIDGILTFVFDKKILSLNPARYISSLIIDDKCCQEVVIDTFTKCNRIISLNNTKTDLGAEIC